LIRFGVGENAKVFKGCRIGKRQGLPRFGFYIHHYNPLPVMGVNVVG
jgi:hypothetical protein